MREQTVVRGVTQSVVSELVFRVSVAFIITRLLAKHCIRHGYQPLFSFEMDLMASQRK